MADHNQDHGQDREPAPIGVNVDADATDADLAMAFGLGRTSPADAERARRRADEDPLFAAEAAFAERVRLALREGEPPDMHAFGWARLRRAMNEAAGIRLAPAASGRRFFAAPASRWRAIAAAAAGLAAVEAALLMGRPSGPAGGYVTATAPTGGCVCVQATFVGTAVEAEIRALLLRIDGEIVGGPGAAGVYRIGFRDEDARRNGLATMRAAEGLVTFATVE